MSTSHMTERSQNIIRLLYENRDRFLEPGEEKAGAYLSPNPIHRKIFWQRMFLAQRLVNSYCKNFDSAIDYGTNQGVIIPFLVSRFDAVTSIDLPHVRVKAKQTIHLPDMLAFFDLSISKLDYVDVDPYDQHLEAIADNSADCIIATDVLEHSPDLPTLAANLRRVIKPGG